jgi:TfoX/Sxy family transcriptional regulator of competence genes
MTPQERYETLVEQMLGLPDVRPPSQGRGFGSGALTVGGRIFAMLTNDRLVVKLPRQRVDALLAAGEGDRFDPGHGRIMKEWLSVSPGQEERWDALAREAHDFVSKR